MRSCTACCGGWVLMVEGGCLLYKGGSCQAARIATTGLAQHAARWHPAATVYSPPHVPPVLTCHLLPAAVTPHPTHPHQPGGMCSSVCLTS
jgi:hypothetical protein